MSGHTWYYSVNKETSEVRKTIDKHAIYNRSKPSPVISICQFRRFDHNLVSLIGHLSTS